MAGDYVIKIRTNDGDKQIDYAALANLPKFDSTLTEAGSIADAKAVGDALAKKAPSSDVANVQARLVTMNTQISGQGTRIGDIEKEIERLINNAYMTEDDLNAKGYVTSDSVMNTLQNYVDTESLENYVTKTSLDNKGYITSVVWDDIGEKPDLASASHVHGLDNLSNVVICESMPTQFTDNTWYLVRAEE